MLLAWKRGRVVVVTLAAAALFSSCTKMLDTSKLQTQIKSGIEQQTSVTVKTVDCPGDVKIKAGGSFECTVTLSDGSTHKVRVTQNDDKGNVHWELES